MLVHAHTSAGVRLFAATLGAILLFSLVPSGAAAADPQPDALNEPGAIRVEPRVQIAHSEKGFAKAGVGRARGVTRVVLDSPPLGLRSQLAARTASGVPLQVGIGRDIDELQTDASTASKMDWEQLASGAWVTAVSVTTPQASSTRAALRITQLPDEARVRFYAPDAVEYFEFSGQEINDTIERNIGAGDHGPQARFFWSPVIDGDTIVIEVEVPDGTRLARVRIALPHLSHLVSSAAEKFVIESQACNVDATCSAGTWGNVMNSVARMLFSDGTGTYLCTGTLLADQGNTGTPYFLTANHCINTQTAASSLTTYWFYRSSSCNSGVLSPNMRQMSGGGVLLYNTATTDTSFLRLNNQPPTGAVFSGWYVASVVGAGTGMTGLHHPGGDLLKISGGTLTAYFTCTPPVNGSFTCSGASTAAATYYNIQWSSGTTEPGSSGSGIFLNNGQYLAGQLYGGSSSCANPTGLNIYGRFDVAYQAGIKNWLAASALALTVSKTGTGTGTVTSAPSGINCGTTCSANFTSGSAVTLTASPAQGSSFAGWSGGGCSGTGTCTVTMNAATTVTATFNTSSSTSSLTVLKAGTGTGTITSAPAGIDCGATCTANFTTGTTITLTAAAAPGSIFSGWSGVCSGTGSCTVVLAAATSVRASFTTGATYALTTINDGTGQGTVVSSTPAGTSCSGTCSNNYPAGTSVTLTAVPITGSIFTGWSGGGCSGTAPCTVTVGADTTVRATFDLGSVKATLTVTKSGIGTGRVVSAPVGINCGTACIADFGFGTSVELTPVADPGSVFTGWTGICSGLGTCILTMTSNLSVKATFTTGTSTFPLSVTTSGNGSGTVTSSPVGISCPSACEVNYNSGSVVTLTATPAAGSVFAGWSGACSGTGSCTVTMTAARAVSATFTSSTSTFAVSVSTTGNGAGFVTSSPAGINCPSACAASYASGTTVTLTASASTGSTFVGWSGSCTGTGACVVTSAATVAATFNSLPGAGPITLSATSVAFGGVSMGTTSRPATITLTNAGTQAISISGVTSSEPQFTAAANNNCASLQAGQSCSVFLWFSPRAAAGAVGSTVNLAGLLTISSNAIGGPYTISLSGVAEKSLVSQFYSTILNRVPDAAGKAYWEGEALRVVTLGADVNEVWYVLAGSFFNSLEYRQSNRSSTQYVTDLYNTFFSRSPDEGGLAYWNGQIAAGMPREVVLLWFMFSQEFRTFTTSIFGSASVRAEVNVVMDLYRGTLNRLPDDAAFAYWLGAMRAAQCAGAGAVYAEVNRSSSFFIYSTEYASRARSNVEFVADMYYAFLRRGGDLPGVQFWVNQLASGAMTREDVRQMFINSPEVGARVQALIAAGCMR